MGLSAAPTLAARLLAPAARATWAHDLPVGSSGAVLRDGGAFMAAADRKGMPRRRLLGSRNPIPPTSKRFLRGSGPAELLEKMLEVALSPTGECASDQVLRASVLASLRVCLSTQGFGDPYAVANLALIAPGEQGRGS
eukprot:6468499-Amphidinium_carterae.4